MLSRIQDSCSSLTQPTIPKQNRSGFLCLRRTSLIVWWGVSLFIEKTDMTLGSFWKDDKRSICHLTFKIFSGPACCFWNFRWTCQSFMKKFQWNCLLYFRNFPSTCYLFLKILLQGSNNVLLLLRLMRVGRILICDWIMNTDCIGGRNRQRRQGQRRRTAGNRESG